MSDSDRGGEPCWTVRELRRELERFEQDLRAANLAESSVQTYVDRSRRFVSWLAGEYTPGQQSGAKAR